MDKERLEKTLAACLADCPGLRAKKYRLPHTPGRVGMGTLRGVYCDVDVATSSVTDARLYIYGQALEAADHDGAGPINIIDSVAAFYDGILTWPAMLEDATEHIIDVMTRRRNDEA